EDRRSEQVVAELKKYDDLNAEINKSAALTDFWKFLNAADANVKSMRDPQLRAIKIVLTVTGKSADDLYAEYQAFNQNVNQEDSVNPNRLSQEEIASFVTETLAYPLTEEDNAIPNEQKISYAIEQLLTGTSYSINKEGVMKNVTAAMNTLQVMQDEAIKNSKHTADFWRTLHYSSSATIIVIMFIMFGALTILLVTPLTTIANKIKLDETLDDKNGLYEIRFLSYSYNELLKRRNLLESDLRAMAETDALTGLPNRFAFNAYMVKESNSPHSPITMFSFDINGLKETNDSRGHLAGDELIRSAAECILNTFGDIERRNCFRLGGDEFAAVVKGDSPEAIKEMVEKFKRKQEKYGVSVAYGYASTSVVTRLSSENTFLEADKNMYECKLQMKRENE
ncbi:MAG: GGDEF domain-containing protein, partial [Clostridia bacterium]|nr:GGDEF domain-containing protein [Clostridia bacterium]